MNPVYEIIKEIPTGEVTTYGAIGKKLNISPRLVGRILHNNPDPKKYPCHRVVRSDGCIAEGYTFGGKEGQIEKLNREGVEIKNGKICDFKKYLI